MRKKALVLVLVCLTAISLFAFTACNKDTSVPPESVIMQSKASIWIGIGKGSLYFTAGGTWQMDMVVPEAFQPDDYQVTWCYGDYYAENVDGKTVLTVKVDPDKGDPENIRLVASDGNLVENGNHVSYYPNDNGVYNIKITIVDDKAQSEAKDFSTASFEFSAPTDIDLPARPAQQ